MNTLTLYYGTNRGHLGSQRFSPTGYGPKFSGDGAENLRFGNLGEGALTSLRITQPLIGLGLLEAVPDEALRAIAREQIAQGIHGRPNEVWDALGGRTALGRFGWKANQPSLRQQIAAAAIGDMGVTSELYREQNCPPVQLLCIDETPGAPAS